jgi:hypothetical protein
MSLHRQSSAPSSIVVVYILYLVFVSPRFDFMFSAFGLRSLVIGLRSRSGQKKTDFGQVPVVMALPGQETGFRLQLHPIWRAVWPQVKDRTTPTGRLSLEARSD